MQRCSDEKMGKYKKQIQKRKNKRFKIEKGKNSKMHICKNGKFEIKKRKYENANVKNTKK